MTPKLKPWTLLKTEDASTTPHFPLEKRTYRLPNGQIIKDFYVTTLQDAAHIIPVTPEGDLIMIRMYKPGVDQIVTQFPAGRFEPGKHHSMLDCAKTELHEEAGIDLPKENFRFLGKYAIMTTKSTEYAHVYLAQNAIVNSTQQLDQVEAEIEVITVKPEKVDRLIETGDIIEAPTITSWHLYIRSRNR